MSFLTLLLCAWCPLLAAAARPSTCNVMDYGARCDGQTEDGKAIQKALDTCRGGPDIFGPPVIIPAGRTCVSQPIFLFNGTILEIQQGATLKAGKKWEVTPFIGSNYIWGVEIRGPGTVDGSGKQWWGKKPGRPKLIHLQNCFDVVIRDIWLVNSSEFHLDLDQGGNATVTGVRIRSPPYNVAPNTDGIDIGVKGAHVSNCDVRNGDDSICIKPGASDVLVENCYIEQGLGPNIGTGDLETTNITYRNIVVNRTNWGIRIKFKPGQKGYVRDVLYENITIVDAGFKAMDINLYGQSVEGENIKPAEVRVSNFTFRNIVGNSKNMVGTFLCSPTLPCTNITLDHVHLRGPVPWMCEHIHGLSRDVSPPSCVHS